MWLSNVHTYPYELDTAHDEDVAEILHTADQSVQILLYTNAPLEFPDSIRVFRIEPACPDSATDLEIKVQIFTERLFNIRGKFDALSYTWDLDLSVPDRGILANGCEILVGQTLYDFLAQLKRENVTNALWADAICIDQGDGQEKNHQVRLMSMIYSSAKRTRSWLGNDLEDISMLMEEFGRCGVLKWPKRLKGQTLAAERLIRLLDHRYWTRTWILQELILANEVILQCCSQALFWNDFINFTRCICSKAGIKYLPLHAESILMLIAAQRNDDTPSTLPELVMNYGTTKCSDHRDRVFAVIG